MYEWNGFDCIYDYSFGFACDYAYGNRKGPHKQSLICKMIESLSRH